LTAFRREGLANKVGHLTNFKSLMTSIIGLFLFVGVVLLRWHVNLDLARKMLNRHVNLRFGT
jgi:hypothetical protein